MKKAMCVLFYGCAILILLVAATGCQPSDNGGGNSLKADQIVFDTACTISVFAQEQNIALGTFESNGIEITFSISEPNTVKGMIYRNSNGVFTISLDDLTLETPPSVSSESNWFVQLANIIHYAKEQPQMLAAQESGQFSGVMDDGTEFTITVRNKGVIENITVNQFRIQFL